MPAVEGSRWQRFKHKWQNCSLCKLHETRRNIVFCRGCLPCDVLFIGEAPGASEDMLGQPFVGPAGKLLDSQIEDAMRNVGLEGLRLCFTNLVCCIPKEGGKKIGEPEAVSIKACERRLNEFIDLCEPSLTVSVGDLSHKYRVADCKITHPAAILRAEVVRQALMYQKVVVTLENEFKERF